MGGGGGGEELCDNDKEMENRYDITCSDGTRLLTREKD